MVELTERCCCSLERFSINICCLQLQDSIKLIVALKGKAEEVAFLVHVIQYKVQCLAVLPFSGMLVKPVAGWVADTFSLHRAVFLVCLAAMGVGYFRCLLQILCI